jgi:NAD(P)H-hydrate epimerase
MWLRDGPERCGEVEVVDLGYDAVPDAGALATAEVPDAADLTWPRRRRADHKRKSGHLLVVAGSAAMAGAAVLVCRGALAAGAGLVTLCAPRGARSRLGSLVPEVMVLDGGPGDRLEGLPSDLRAFDAIAAGPGVGAREALPERLASDLATLWAGDRRPAVFDADALLCTGPSRMAERVLTPHAGEAGRLLGIDASTVEADRVGWARHLAARGTVLLKGPFSLVAAEGTRLSINPTGGPVLASGGTGDVLTGIIGALLARGLAARDAARVGAFVHGVAADRLAGRRKEGWRASDVAREIPAAVTATWG